VAGREVAMDAQYIHGYLFQDDFYKQWIKAQNRKQNE
jgi:hypothetical protein